MKLQNIPFSTTDWNTVAPVAHEGETGVSHWRSFEAGNIRVRMIEYSPGFRSDHYCERGHVLLVLQGELCIRLKNGSEHRLVPGMSFQVADDTINPHLAYTETGAKVFVVD